MTESKETIEVDIRDMPKILGGEQLTQDGIPMVKSKVAIVGFAPSTMRDVKNIWDDPELEIWGLNQLYMAFPMIVERATRWFQIHSRESYDSNVNRDHSHHEWLTKQTRFPIYMQKKEPDIPMSVRFPVEAFFKVFPRYFTNSISWELATAILETMQARALGFQGFTDIYIFGVDMATDSEYAFERPCVEYHIGWAKGLGINVHVPQKSDLLKSMWLYPYEDSSPMRTKIQSRRAELRDRINNLAIQEQNSRDARNQLIGACENMNYIEMGWMNSAKEINLTNE